MPDRHIEPIIFIIHKFTFGGAEKVAKNILEFWISEGRRVELITIEESDNNFYKIPKYINHKNIGINKPSKNIFSKIYKNIVVIYRLRSQIKSINASRVLSFLTRTNVQTILACINLGKKVIISERNDTAQQRHMKLISILRRFLYRFADLVTANSKNSINDMKRYVPYSKLVFIPNMVRIPNKIAKPDKSKIIINVGRLVSQKHQDILIEAFVELFDRHKEWYIKLLGEGDKRDYLISLTKKNKLNDNVIFCGLIHDPKPYYISAGIFVLPSIYEGTPNALLEAMAYGLPCIISDTLPGALEIVNNGVNGLVFQSGNKIDLANKLQTLMNNPGLRKKLGLQARNSVKHFKPKIINNEWNRILFTVNHNDG